jgi:hypothetical protein
MEGKLLNRDPRFTAFARLDKKLILMKIQYPV